MRGQRAAAGTRTQVGELSTVYVHREGGNHGYRGKRPNKTHEGKVQTSFTEVKVQILVLKYSSTGWRTFLPPSVTHCAVYSQEILNHYKIRKATCTFKYMNYIIYTDVKMFIFHCPGAVISVIAVYCNKVQQQETKPAVLWYSDAGSESGSTLAASTTLSWTQ